MNVLSVPPKIQNQHPLMFPSSSSFSRFRFIISPNFRSLCTTFRRSKVRVTAAESVEMKENWLESLSCPFEQQDISLSDVSSSCEERKSDEEGCLEKWVIGIDPDINGALALLKDSDGFGVTSVSAEVFDTPHLRVMVGKKIRKRLDARSIVQLLLGLGAPQGTTAYIEQSSPCPQDGKLGWWSGGFTYGLWIGILVSSGFTVVPISSRVWKDHFQLFRNSSNKDDSRSTALDLFPSLSSSLKRKKDHGRAEALLIAAYGMGIKIQPKAFETVINGTSPPTVLSMQETAISEHLVID